MDKTASSTSILICGAGPTGLVLGLWLAKKGVPFRIIDKAPAAGTASRAIIVQARTLEFYRQLGIEAKLPVENTKVDQIHFWVNQKEVGVAHVGGVVTDISAYPFFFVFPQDEHEAFLEKELNQLGIHVERNTELIAFEEKNDGIEAWLQEPNGKRELVRADYLAGCDGAHSKVREIINAGFPGGTYDHMFYVADVDATGPVVNGQLNGALDDADFLAIFPMRRKGQIRLIGTIEQSRSDRSYQWGDVSQDILRRLQINILSVNWFSTYRVHHRVASFFRKGRAFLVGDAAHVHSPVGGQGMNTGIGDAVNLAWKLEAMVRQGAPDHLLDTYEQERIRFARSLVRTTDRIFAFISKRSRLAALIRTRLAPIAFSAAFRNTAIRRAIFRLVSQTRIKYHHSWLSEGAMGRVRGGDRLPWLKEEDNFAPLNTLAWQVHCYGDAPKLLVEWCEGSGIPLHAFAAAGRIPANCLCLIRPDGYIGWVGHLKKLPEMIRYANAHSVLRLSAGLAQAALTV